MKVSTFALLLGSSAVVGIGSIFFVFNAESNKSKICIAIPSNMADIELDRQQSYASYLADINKCLNGDIFAVYSINSDHQFLNQKNIINHYCDSYNTTHVVPAGTTFNIICTFTTPRKNRE